MSVEFEMPLGQSKNLWRSLNEFEQGYVKAMFFTECHSDNPELEDATLYELSPEALAKVRADCAAFQRRASAWLAQAYELDYGPDQAGRDYWFSRNGHGVGYWDRDLGAVGDTLHSACKWQSCDLYRGDDGKLYLA